MILPIHIDNNNLIRSESAISLESQHEPILPQTENLSQILEAIEQFQSFSPIGRTQAIELFCQELGLPIGQYLTIEHRWTQMQQLGGAL